MIAEQWQQTAATTQMFLLPSHWHHAFHNLLTRPGQRSQNISSQPERRFWSVVLLLTGCKTWNGNLHSLFCMSAYTVNYTTPPSPSRQRPPELCITTAASPNRQDRFVFVLVSHIQHCFIHAEHNNRDDSDSWQLSAARMRGPVLRARWFHWPVTCRHLETTELGFWLMAEL